VLVLCELLVAVGLTQRIELSRLPVGHTHEDIDSKFAKIWVGMRNCSVLTPQVISYYFKYFIIIYILMFNICLCYNRIIEEGL